jgi:uncharacterized membrane protein YkgB
VAITAKDLEAIIEAVRTTRVLDPQDIHAFSEKLEALDTRISTIQQGVRAMSADHAALKQDMQGLLEAWRAAGTLVGTAKVASKVVGAIAALLLAIGVIGAIITHPEVWFTKGT